MNIKEISFNNYFIVTTDEEYPYQYYRHSKDCWTVSYGESIESFYDCEDLEFNFQEFLKSSSDYKLFFRAKELGYDCEISGDLLADMFTLHNWLIRQKDIVVYAKPKGSNWSVYVDDKQGNHLLVEEVYTRTFEGALRLGLEIALNYVN